MKSRSLILGTGLLLVLVLAGYFGLQHFRPPPAGSHAGGAVAGGAVASDGRPLQVAGPSGGPAHRGAIKNDGPSLFAVGRSEVADGLNADTGSIEQDLRIVNGIFEAWLSNFRREGNPAGSNREVTAALQGSNRLGVALIPVDHPAVNAAGELCDRWGTPFRFHPLSRFQMEIRSAGADRRFGTPDDVEWAPWPKNF